MNNLNEGFQPDVQSPTNEQTDYLKYRGKCKEYAEAECTKNPNLILTRGWYHCPFWGPQQHWWCIDSNTGTIVDPTKGQFPSKGFGHYVEYDGILNCEYCGKEIKEEDAYFVEHHVYCCGEHYYRDVM